MRQYKLLIILVRCFLPFLNFLYESRNIFPVIHVTSSEVAPDLTLFTGKFRARIKSVSENVVKINIRPHVSDVT
jgi:hypothetical protein